MFLLKAPTLNSALGEFQYRNAPWHRNCARLISRAKGANGSFFAPESSVTRYPQIKNEIVVDLPNRLFSICSHTQMETVMSTATDFTRLIECDHDDAGADISDISVAVKPSVYERIKQLLAIANDPSVNELEAIRARKEGLALVAKVLNVSTD
jgi:hypothetical protein